MIVQLRSAWPAPQSGVDLDSGNRRPAGRGRDKAVDGLVSHLFYIAASSFCHGLTPGGSPATTI
jgi:hypothetical protein